MADRSFDVSIILSAIDNASSTLKNVGITSVAVGNLITEAVKMGAKAVADFSQKVVDAASEQQQAEIILGAAMKRTGQYSEEALQKAINYSSALQMQLGISDALILKMQETFVTYGAEGQMIEKLTKATIDFAKSKGMDLVSASQLVGKTIASNSNAMARYGIDVQGASGSVQRMSSVLNGFSMFSGRAEAEAATFSGRMNVMRERIGELYEKLGFALLPSFEVMVGLINSKVLPAFENISINTETVRKITAIFVDGLKVLASVIMGVVFTFETWGNALGTIGAVIQKILARDFKRPVDVAKRGIDDLSNSTIKQGEVFKQIWAENLETAVTTNAQILDNLKGRIAQETEELIIGSQAHLAIVAQSSKDRADTEKTIRSDMERFSYESELRMVSGWAKAMREMQNAGLNFYQVFRGTIYSIQMGTEASFANLFRNIGQGMLAFRDFAKGIINAIGSAFINSAAEMAAQWLTQHVIMAGISKIFKTQEIASNAAIGASRAAAATAWTLWGAIAVGAAIGAAILALGNSFAVGGIVGGNSFSGDKVVARVNSGEMILNRSQQAQLFAMANGSGEGGGRVININISGNQILNDQAVEDFADTIGNVIMNKLRNERNI